MFIFSSGNKCYLSQGLHLQASFANGRLSAKCCDMPVPLFSLLITCRSSGWRGSCRLCHRSCLGALPSSLAECTVVFMLLFIVHGRCFPKWMIGRPSGDLEYLTIDCLICLYSVLHWIGVVSMKKAGKCHLVIMCFCVPCCFVICLLNLSSSCFFFHASSCVEARSECSA